MFIESRPGSLVLPESPHVVVCFSWLIDGERGLGLEQKDRKHRCQVPETLQAAETGGLVCQQMRRCLSGLKLCVQYSFNMSLLTFFRTLKRKIKYLRTFFVLHFH